ncbi:protein YgfX [Eionea flava]
MKTPVCNPTSSIHFGRACVSPSARLVRLSPSLRLFGIALLLHITALFCLVLSSIPVVVVAMGLLLLCISLFNLFYRYISMPLLSLHHIHGDWLLMPEAQQRAKYYGNNVWSQEGAFSLVGWSYCSRFLLILSVQSAEGRLRYLPVAFDSCRSDEFRWLKVVIKYMVSPPNHSDRLL